MKQIIPTAEPFFLPGQGKRARTGCLVSHGFTGAPKEMRWMGEYLNQQGYSVCGVRLNGHATKPEDMVRAHWQDWLLTIEDGYEMLRAGCDEVFLLGLSMGGVLTLTASAFLPVRGVVAMSTPFKIENPLLPLAGALSLLVPYMPKGKGPPGDGWFDMDVWRQHVAYPRNPVRSAGELYKLLGVMRSSLPQVKVPVLLIHSRDDDYVFKGSMDAIHDLLGTDDKQKLWVEGGGHVITEEPTRHEVFRAAGEFIQRVSGG